MPPVPPATPESNMSVVGVVTPSGVCVPVLISEPWYWLPALELELPPRELPLLRGADFFEEEPPREALLPELLEADLPAAELREADLPAAPPEDFLGAAFLGAAFLGADFLAAPFFAAAFLGAAFLAAFLGAAFFNADFFPAAFFGADFFAADFFPAAFLGAAFFAAFFGADFLAAVFLEADFFDAPLPEDEPRPDDLDPAFLAAAFDEDLPPELLLADFFAAAFLVDFAILMGF
jgi:hypothetical protein